MRVEVKDDRSTEEINEYSHHHRSAVDFLPHLPHLPRHPAHDRNKFILEYGGGGDDGGPSGDGRIVHGSCVGAPNGGDGISTRIGHGS